MPDLERIRRDYAEAVRRRADVRSDALVRAFATVPREHYLGPGPWRIVSEAGYTSVDDVACLYTDVLVAIDESRKLNNGQPSALASWFDQLELAAGERVAHVGCGVGYYTAVLAETVGFGGTVLGVEIDPGLAERAKTNLAAYPNVRVTCADGSRAALGECDAVFVNAGATHPERSWLDALAVGGRAILPMTVALGPGAAGVGWMLRVHRTDAGLGAAFVSPVGIFPCAGARDDEEDPRLRRAFEGGRHESVRSLRLEPHADSGTCWLHGHAFCLSTAEPGDW